MKLTWNDQGRLPEVWLRKGEAVQGGLELLQSLPLRKGERTVFFYSGTEDLKSGLKKLLQRQQSSLHGDIFQ